MSDLLVSLAVESSIRAAALVAMVAIILALFRIRSSGTRHAAWTVVLVAMLLMPVLTRIVPAIHVPALHVPQHDSPLGVLVPPPPVPRIDTPLPSLPSSLTSGATVLPVPPPGSDPGDEPPASPVQWNVIGLVVYFTGVTFFLVRFVIGLYRLSRIYESSQRIAAIPGDIAWESKIVATPVTIGLLASRVILPVSWRGWSPEMLAAVLAHERAHAARRDPLIAVIARVNVAVFWFNPLTWWLERRLATLAEHACDDAALTQVSRRQYADTLLDIAATVRRHQGRLVWQGVGVDGDGRLGQRIDRVLSGTSWPQASRTRRALVAASCAVVIAIAVACQQEAKVAPLRENPEVAANVKKEMELMARFGEPRPGTPTSIEEAAALERQLTRNPEDSVTREMLLSFYQWTGKNTQPWNDNVAARRRHALWLVEHHPEHSLVMRAPVTKETDPEGYAQLRKRWLAVTAPSKVHPRVLLNAAWFFALPEGHPSRPAGQQEISVAEGLLLRALAQPEERRAVDFYSAGGGGGYRSMALSRLVSLYVSALAPRPGQAEDPTLAAWAKQRLDGSGDAEVLLTAGEQLYFRRETRELARSYLERVSRMQVDYYPQRARELIAQNDARYDAAFPFGTAPNSEWRAIVEKSTGALKLRQLAAIAAREYQMAEYYDWRTKQPAGGANASPDAEQDKRMAADGFANAKKYAREAIDLASSLKGTGVGEAAFNAHIAYGLAVLREGDRKGAVEHLQAAAMLPAPNGGIGRWASGQEYRLVFYLLKNGERQTIVDYFERAAQGRDEARKKVMLESASAIREGRMPEHYQRLVATGNL